MKMRIIPAIDILGGKCVRLSKGDYNTQKVYYEDPLDAAKEFEDHGVEYVHLVDLDGARSAHIVNYRVLEQIAGRTRLKVDFGGGIKSDSDVRTAFDSGASQITGGSIAVKDRELFLGWLAAYGQERIILGADARNGKIAVSGWEEASDTELEPFVAGYFEAGIRFVICTDISRDGMLKGPATGLYKKLIQTIPGKAMADDLQGSNGRDPGLLLIASGGIRSLDDLQALEESGCEGAIIGKAIYEGRIGLKELEQFILDN